MFLQSISQFCRSFSTTNQHKSAKRKEILKSKEFLIVIHQVTGFFRPQYKKKGGVEVLPKKYDDTEMADKYEYKVIKNPKTIMGAILLEPLEKELNNLGQDGWELVSTPTGKDLGNLFLILKRAL